MNSIHSSTGAAPIMAKKQILNVSFFQSLVWLVLLCAGISVNGQTTKGTSPSKSEKSDTDSAGMAVKNLDKPFNQLSFEKVRVMAVTPDIGPEKPAPKPAANATQQTEQSRARTTSESNSTGSNFSFGMYLAPPSSSFGTLVRSMQEQVDTRSQARDADARQTSVDRMLGYVAARPIHFGPVDLKFSLGSGSVRTDGLDQYDDHLWEKPQFVKHEDATP
jgi:hypothetical protein